MATISRLTKRIVDRLKPGPKDIYVWDTSLPGFGVRASAVFKKPDGTEGGGVKTFVVQYRIGRGRAAPGYRRNLGHYGEWTVDQARKRAKDILRKAETGIDPLADGRRVRPRAVAGVDVGDQVSIMELLAQRRASGDRVTLVDLAREKAQTRTLTVADLCDAYLEEAHVQKPGKKAVSWYTDRLTIGAHVRPRLGPVPVAELTRIIIEQFQHAIQSDTGRRNRRGGALGGPAAAARVIGTLGGVLTWGIRLGIAGRDDNPIHGVSRIKIDRRQRILEPEEKARLGAALSAAEARGANPQAIAALRLLALTGCRKGEITGLQWAWISMDKGIVSLPDSKTGAKVMRLGAAAMELLRKIHRTRVVGSPYVFPSLATDGRGANLNWLWRKVRAETGLPELRIHDLRHNWATDAVTAGESLYQVSKALGHKHLSTTERYATVGDQALRGLVDRISDKAAAAYLSSTEPAEVVALPKVKEAER